MYDAPFESTIIENNPPIAILLIFPMLDPIWKMSGVLTVPNDEVPHRYKSSVEESAEE
jgi:hypothetical protein